MSTPVCFASCARICGVVAILAGAALNAGCAQNRQAGYYDPPPASTRTDAQYQAEGAAYRSVLHAPSQLRIELKPTPTAQQQQQKASAAHASNSAESNPSVPANNAATELAAPSPAAHAAAQLVPQPQTYMGTLPCFLPGVRCAAQRVTLTLAPNGRWRGRISAVDGERLHTPPFTEQGCWAVTGEQPPRILLLDAQSNARAEFVLSTHNVLRVKSVAGHVPNVDYSLTRQPDLDPIDELTKQSAPKCP